MERKIEYSEMLPVEVYTLVAKGKLKKFPNGYLHKSAIKEIIRHLILDVHHYTREDVIKLNHDFFQHNSMGGFRKFFEYGDSEALVYSFPEWELQYWEFRKVPPKFWTNPQNQTDFIKWICIKEGWNINSKEDLRKITADIIEKYGGSKPMVHSGGLYELLNVASGGRYKKWELIKMVSWSEQDIIDSTKWLIEEKLKYAPEQVCKIKVADFAKYNLDGMLQKGCNHSILTALELAYPGKYYRTKSRGLLFKE